MPNAADIIENTLSDDLLAEIHRLLWIEPFYNKGKFDAGWSCREHALIVGCLLEVYGISAQVVSGKNMFVRGQSNGRPPVGFGQEVQGKEGHMWLEIEGYGVLDVSPNISGDAVPLPHWTTIPFKGIFGNRWSPANGGDFIQCDSELSYSSQIARCSHLEDGIQAIYWPQQRENLNASMVQEAFDFMNSPLTDYLRRNFARDVYSKAILHFIDRTEGKGRSLAGVSRNKGWSLIAGRSGNATEEVLKKLDLNQMTYPVTSR